MLVGRDAERQRLGELLERARGGRSAVLVLRGEAGIGKTALLDWTAERAADFRLLRATGVESEAEIAFGSLLQLLQPIVHRTSELPPPQRRALGTALAMVDGPVPDPLAISAATLNLLSRCADDRPLLCVVDDAHWIDHGSAETLTFAARRLTAEAVVMVFATREPERTRFAAETLPELRVGPLTPAVARALLSARWPELSERAAKQLVRLTHGNPLALLEYPHSSSAARLRVGSPLDEPLPVSGEIEQLFLQRARLVSAEARRLLVLVAASNTGDADALWKVLDDENLTGQPLAETRAAALIVIDPLRFCHPLVRSAVYHLARPAERRVAHAALGHAAVEPDLRAWHLAAAAEGPDERIAAALEAAAENARARGGVAAEARALLRAGELTLDPERRAVRLLKGALAAEAAGWVEEAETILDEVARTTTNGELRARAVSRRSYLLADRGEFERAYAVASDEAERASPKQAAHVLAGGAFMAVSHRLDIAATVELAERAQQLAGSATSVDLDLCEMLSRAYVLAGRVAEARSLAGTAIANADPGSVVATDFATDLMYLEDYPRARDALERIVSRTRAADASGNLSYALDQLAKLETRIGNLAAAYILELEAVQLAETRVAKAASLAWLALTEALLGRPGGGEHARQALEIAEETNDEFNVVRARAALGVAALARGALSDAVDWFAPAARKVADGGVGLPNFFRLDGDLIEALTRLGRIHEAKPHLHRLDDQAEATASPWALATAARCRALAASDRDLHDRFDAALELHDHEPSPFERARTQLCFGERLRRARQRRNARVQLRAALETFERIEAQPWADRARNELRATGEHLPPRGPTAVERLTPQEFQIAALVAEGLTNRDVAMRLYLSPKTIEFHLSRAFRKLGLRSRGELIRLFATQPIEQEQYLA